MNGTNKWTPAIYKSVTPVCWTTERNRSYNLKGRKVQIIAKGVSKPNYKK